jgi:hypothetical protein
MAAQLHSLTLLTALTTFLLLSFLLVCPNDDIDRGWLTVDRLIGSRPGGTFSVKWNDPSDDDATWGQI